MIENEFKIMLTREQYETLYAAYEWDREIVQTNNYYDTPELELSQRHITCRVRATKEGAALQMKFPNGTESFSRVELEQELSCVPERLSAELLNGLAGGYIGGLPAAERLGQLTTKRCVKQFDGAELDLDMSTYFSRTDYEAEIEFTDEETARALRKQVSELAGLPECADVCEGKIRRFLTEYKKHR